MLSYATLKKLNRFCKCNIELNKIDMHDINSQVIKLIILSTVNHNNIVYSMRAFTQFISIPLNLVSLF